MLFRPKPPIDQDEFDWLHACFAWLRTVLDDADIKPEFVTPAHRSLVSAKTGPELFEAVRSLAGMQDWDCKLELVTAREDVTDLQLVEGCGAAGTFSVEDGQAVIRYRSDMLKQPDALAGTFAHELCHYLLANAGDPPGGPDLMEHSTDCAAIYLGFGVMLSNSARQAENFVDVGGVGWRSWTAGYLSEQARVTATAMFAALHGYSLDDAGPYLKPYLRKDLRKAAKAVDYQHPNFEASLERIDLLEWNFD
ncbi:hypothetical protein ACRAQ7_12170 [Erythrobacter sp. W53]|uniref:hypothetical protein n=1 Tax=Erythrobacter sp. W53 TaxID=3425947 RepID=UPI003D768142